MPVTGGSIWNPSATVVIDLNTIVRWYPMSATVSRLVIAAYDWDDNEDDVHFLEYDAPTAAFEAVYQAWADLAGGPAPAANFTDPANSQYVPIISHFA